MGNPVNLESKGHSLCTVNVKKTQLQFYSICKIEGEHASPEATVGVENKQDRPYCSKQEMDEPTIGEAK